MNARTVDHGPVESHPPRSAALGWRGMVVVVAAACMALGAAAIALTLSRHYYSEAPYHYDSAAYRVAALELHDTLQEQGWPGAARAALKTKDSLDILLRLLLAPTALQERYGHMVILVPGMALFMVLTGLYVFRKTGCMGLALLPPATLFTYHLFYNAYWGIADYWKDNLATWMLGAAIVAWLLSENLRKAAWGALAGWLLGMTAMQRTSAAVYAGLLFLPLIAWAVFVRWRTEGVRKAMLRTGAFVFPAAILGGLVLCMQARQLYDYYVKGGYAYGTPLDVYRFLLSGISPRLARPQMDFFPGTEYGIGPGFLLLAPGYLAAFIAARGWSPRHGDIGKALWCALGLPLILVATSTYYYGVFALWPAVLVVLLAALLAHVPASRWTLPLVLLLALGIALGSLHAYRDHTNRNDAIAARSAGYRTLLLELGKLVTDGTPAARPYATFFNETGAPFANHVRFDLGRKVGPPAIFITFHDQYFARNFPGRTPNEIVASEMRRLEGLTGAMAIGHADVAHLYQPEGDPIASATIRGFNLYLQNNPRWEAIKELPSPFGLLRVYRFNPDR